MHIHFEICLLLNDQHFKRKKNVNDDRSDLNVKIDVNKHAQLNIQFQFHIQTVNFLQQF